MGFQIKICLSVTKEDIYFGFGMKEWMKLLQKCLHFTPSRNRAHGKRSRSIISSGVGGCFFCLMQETVRLSRYMI